MIPLREARQAVLSQLTPLGAVRVPLASALATVAAEDVLAPGPVPPFANSAMDGYALRSVDTVAAPVDLRVVGTLAAGQESAVVVGPGEAVRIMTGAALPNGADAVCMVERTQALDGTVLVEVPVCAGEHVRLAGEDVRAGDLLVAEGTLLGPGHLGVIANSGATSVLVRRRPRVAVLSTGDELVNEGERLAPAKIHDANRPSLVALVTQSGMAASDLGIVADDLDRIVAALAGAAPHHDAIVVSGGVSVGDFDMVRVALDRISEGAMQWMQVAVKPAKPMAFGLLRGSGLPIFGLPGNPVSAMVSFELFVRPSLRLMAGHRVLDRPSVRAWTDEDFPRRPDGKLHLVRVCVRLDADGRVHVRPSGGQGSHQLSAMARADGLALLPDGEGVARGDRLVVLLLDAGELAPAPGLLPW
jgi:molybdenum cofactor synthesis domain-containing protein